MEESILAKLMLGVMLVTTPSLSAVHPTMAQQGQKVVAPEVPVYVGKRCEGIVNSLGFLCSKALMRLNFPSPTRVHVLLDTTSGSGSDYVDFGVNDFRGLGDRYGFEFVVRGATYRMKSTFDPARTSISLDGDTAFGARLFGKISC